jgi:hypothetical protein
MRADVLHKLDVRSLTMPTNKLSDGEAKTILLGWPGRTKIWPPPGGSGFWIRAQPKFRVKAGPTLSAPGASLFHTQPDGMWVHFRNDESCDVVVVEVCGTAQNLNDKRSRYIPASHSVVVRCSLSWLQEHIPTKAGASAPRWEASRCFAKEPTIDIAVPVRHLRVLYTLPDKLYHKWCAEHVPTGQEFFCPHSSLNGFNGQKMQVFLKQMSMSSQFYVQPKV